MHVVRVHAGERGTVRPPNDHSELVASLDNSDGQCALRGDAHGRRRRGCFMPGGTWAVADVAWLVGSAAAVATVGTLILVVPFTLVGSVVPGPFAVGLPPRLLIAVGCGSYLHKFGMHSPVTGDRQLAVALIWSSPLVGQKYESSGKFRGVTPSFFERPQTTENTATCEGCASAQLQSISY
jgi:hypothetical protein